MKYVDGRKEKPTNKEKYFILLMDWWFRPPPPKKKIVPCVSQQKALAAFSQALSSVATVRLRHSIS
jgi:hypothetical protein